ncbi:hypothetical protein V8E54_010512 [Elaphomyces granulatus]
MATPPPNGSANDISRKLTTAFGLPVWIHRPSSIIRDDEVHIFQDLIPNLFRFSRVPRFTGIQRFLNFVPVDMVVQGILQQVDSVARMEVQYINQIGDPDVSLTELREFFERDTGDSFDILPPIVKALALNCDQVAAFTTTSKNRAPLSSLG